MSRYIGKTQILMHNVHTGKDEKVKHGNVFRGENIQRYLRTYGCFGNRMSDMSIPLWQDVIGGILLLDRAIPVTSTVVSSGDVMVANGAYGILNSGDPVEMGSWNDTESSISAEGDTITLVYDWNTSQGNGTIASVCLTSYTAGYIGIGNASGTIKAVGAFGDQSRRTPTYNFYANTYVSNNRRITFKTFANNILTLEIKNLWSVNALLDGQTYDKSIELPSKPATMRYSRLLQMSDSKLYLIQSAGDVGINGVLYIDEINTNTWAVTSHYITNTTGYVIGAGGTHTCAISDHEILIRNITDGTKHFILNVDTGEFSELGVEYSAGTPSDSCMRLNEDMILLHGSWVGYPGGSYGVMYDRYKGTLYPVNMSGNSVNIRRPAFFDEVSEGILAYDGAIHNNPWYYATVNNLENPVTKDVSKTMKVIYTLTKAS